MLFNTHAEDTRRSVLALHWSTPSTSQVLARLGKCTVSAVPCVVKSCSAQLPSLTVKQKIPYMTYEQIFDVTELPETMTVIGGGPIGAEIAQVA